MNNDLLFKNLSKESEELYENKIKILNNNQENLFRYIIYNLDMKFPLKIINKNTNDFKSFEEISRDIENYFTSRNIIINAFSNYYSVNT
jgi:hypothetical protein